MLFFRCVKDIEFGFLKSSYLLEIHSEVFMDKIISGIHFKTL